MAKAKNVCEIDPRRAEKGTKIMNLNGNKVTKGMEKEQKFGMV